MGDGWAAAPQAPRRPDPALPTVPGRRRTVACVLRLLGAVRGGRARQIAVIDNGLMGNGAPAVPPSAPLGPGSRIPNLAVLPSTPFQRPSGLPRALAL